MNAIVNETANETALYRKYRPQAFKDVAGQDHVVKVLEGAIANKAVSHAYLFSGSRGTGKTSVARIFAHKIGTSDNDLYEIDAASNRGIDDIREIRDGVSTLPFESPYKVYIIDEVHMLTKEAFNALLKTLEEPPAHAVFILATTELEKVPDTIVSRCQTFLFKKPNQKLLKEIVTAIAKKEGYTLEPAGAELIALLGDGSYRDAEGILQKVISATSGKKISLEEIEVVTGAPRGSLVNDFISALDGRDLARGLKAVHSAAEANIDMKIYAKLLLQKIRAILLLTYAPDMEAELAGELSETDLKFLKDVAGRKTVQSSAVAELLTASELIGRAAVKELPLELALMTLVGQNE
jgi:DNA polymerase III subunit gamma/tau